MNPLMNILVGKVKDFKVLLRTDNDTEFYLSIWAHNEAHADSKSKQLSQGCMVLHI